MTATFFSTSTDFRKWLEKNQEYHKNYWESNKERLNNEQKEKYYKNIESRKNYWQENKEEFNRYPTCSNFSKKTFHFRLNYFL